jgi:diguanylate cyclase (GGDEF)-like protein/PAS domain S-box-containing protein
MADRTKLHSTDKESPVVADRFSLVRWLSITSLLAMLLTATILIFLFRQDQLTEFEKNAREENERVLLHLAYSLNDQINAFVTSSNGQNHKPLNSNPNLDALFSASLTQLKEHNILKLKLYDLSGTVIYSSAKREIGGVSSDPVSLEKAKNGTTISKLGHRAKFTATNGELYDVDIFETYMPISRDGKTIGVLESYDDAAHVVERLQNKTLEIILIVFCAFAGLYAALFFSVRRADTKQKIAEHELMQSEQKFRQAMFHAPIGQALVDPSGRFLDANPKLCNILGFAKEELLQIKFQTITAPDDVAKDLDSVRQIIKGEIDSFVREKRYIHKDGHYIWALLHVAAVRDKSGKHQFNIAQVLDITERKGMEEQIHQLAFYDTLTGLPNRRLLDDRLNQALSAGKRSGSYGAVMFIDLDNFKPLNDTHGHRAGDLLLVEVARRLTGSVREVDTVARFGGDEFVVVLSQLDVDESASIQQAGVIAEKIRVALAGPYWLASNSEGSTKMIIYHKAAASIGVVLFNGNSSPDNVLKWADSAMYQAKEAGRNSIRFYKPNS